MKFALVICVVVAVTRHNALALNCFSCSTKNGDTFCAEDVFKAKNVKVMECPPDADVCVRLLQKSDGSIFRSCGTSQEAMRPEKTNIGYVPHKNRCMNYKSIKESVFPDVEFEMCSCSSDLSNGNGEMRCQVKCGRFFFCCCEFEKLQLI